MVCGRAIGGDEGLEAGVLPELMGDAGRTRGWHEDLPYVAGQSEQQAQAPAGGSRQPHLDRLHGVDRRNGVAEHRDGDV